MPDLIACSKYLMVILGIFAGYFPVQTGMKSAGVRGVWKQLLFCFLMSAAGLFGVMIFAALENVISGLPVTFGAVSVCGVYLVSPLFVYLLGKLLRLKTGDAFDIFAVYVLPTLFLMRINCLMTGCCRGKMIGSIGLSWPVRETEMIFYAVMLIIFLKKSDEIHRGVKFPLLMISYGILRFFVEFFRESPSIHLLHPAHIWSMLILIFGAGACLEIKAQKNKIRRRK